LREFAASVLFAAVCWNEKKKELKRERKNVFEREREGGRGGFSLTLNNGAK
jgi:hypothetical protein